MSEKKSIRFCSWGAVAALLVVAGCDRATPSPTMAFPMGELPKFDQPRPSQPLFGSDKYLRANEVLPPAKADDREPLPAAVPLPPPASSPGSAATTASEPEVN